MPTLTGKGYKLPANGERGSWWADLIFNFTRLDGHTHDGNNSQLIDARNITKQTQDILEANWVADTDGTFYQEITLPGSITFTKLAPTFLVASGSEEGAQVYLSTVKSDTNKYKIFTNNNTLNLRVIYA